MKAGTRSRIAAVVLAVAAIAGAAAVLLIDGENAPQRSPAEASREEPASDRTDRKPPQRPDHQLHLSDHDQPVVTVRRGAEVTLHETPGGPLVRRLGDETEFGSQRSFAVFRREGEWAGVPTPMTGNDALGWIRLDARNLKAAYTELEVVVDLSERRTELLRDGKTERAFIVSVGAPDTSTPVGRFAVTDTFRGNLNTAYGCCAVALTAEQPNLPSGWLGGNRIAIHGTTAPLGEAISAGCVRAADRDVSALVDAVPPGVPVTVRE